MATYYVDNSLGSDANAGTSAGAGNAWATIAKAGAAPVATGDTVNIINTSDYTVTAATALGIAGVLYRGYTTTPGDGGRFVLKTTTNSINLINITVNNVTIQDFSLQHNAGTKGRGIVALTANRNGLVLRNGKIDGCTYGVDGEFVTNYAFLSTLIQNVEVANCTTVGVAIAGGLLSDSLIRDCGDGVRRGAYATGFPLLAVRRSRIYNSTTYGINWASDVGGQLVVDDSVLRLSGSSLLRFNNTSALIALALNDSIVYAAGAYGITAGAALAHFISNNAFRSNTSGNYNATYFTNALGDISLSGDPHTNAAAYDFTLNNTAGAGASCRAAGFSPTVGGASYHDIGGVQHQDAGGSGGGPLIGTGRLVRN